MEQHIYSHSTLSNNKRNDKINIEKLMHDEMFKNKENKPSSFWNIIYIYIWKNITQPTSPLLLILIYIFDKKYIFVQSTRIMNIVQRGPNTGVSSMENGQPVMVTCSLLLICPVTE